MNATTHAVKTLRQSWKQLIDDYENEVFTPRSEHDIECYLYHLCIENGLPAEKIHAEERYTPREDCRLYPDLVIGARPDTKLYVEIKWTKMSGENVISGKRFSSILRDVKKSCKMESKRRRYLLVMLYRKKGLAPLLRRDVSSAHKARLRQLKKDSDAKGVTVLFSLLEPQDR